MAPAQQKPKQIVEGEESTHYVSQRKQRGQAKKQLQPPLTPMIDVTFQLLIFFLVTTTFRPPEGQIPGAVPSTGMGRPTEALPELPQIKIMVAAANVETEKPTFQIIELNVLLEGPDALYSWLVEQAKAGESATKNTDVVIDPAGTAVWGHTVEAYNQAIRAGFEKVAFAPLQ